MKKLMTFTALVALVSSPAFAFTGESLQRQARITIGQARSEALKAHPGRISAEELEREKGGSGLRYSFDIETPRGTQEVGVDAESGRLLENAKEGPNPD